MPLKGARAQRRDGVANNLGAHGGGVTGGQRGRQAKVCTDVLAELARENIGD